MKFPFLASVVIFMVVLHHNLRKGKKIGKRQEDSFWKKEYEANTTRKQPLDDLQFITFQLQSIFLFIFFHPMRFLIFLLLFLS